MSSHENLTQHTVSVPLPKGVLPEPQIIDRIPTQAELAAMYQPAHAETTIPTEVEPQFTYHAKEYVLERLEDFRHDLQTKGKYSPRVEDILHKGKDGTHDLLTDMVAFGAEDEADARIGFVKLLEASRETYEALRDNRIVGFHGTRSIALAGLLKTGKLFSAARINEMDDEGPLMTSGEHYSAGERGQTGISFSNLGHLDTPLEYADTLYNTQKTSDEVIADLRSGIEKSNQALADGEPTNNLDKARAASVRRSQRALTLMETQPKSLEGAMLRLNFPVLLGINADFVDWSAQNPDDHVTHKNTLFGVASMGEFRPMASEIPAEALPVVAVPAERVEGVKRLFAHFNRQADIVPIEDLFEAFVPEGHYLKDYKNQSDSV